MYHAHLMKWLILLFVAWLVWRLLRARPRTEAPSAQTKRGEAMYSCAHCGLNVPESETLTGSDGLSYCCEAHQRLGPAQGTQ